MSGVSDHEAKLEPRLSAKTNTVMRSMQSLVESDSWLLPKVEGGNFAEQLLNNRLQLGDSSATEKVAVLTKQTQIGLCEQSG